MKVMPARGGETQELVRADEEESIGPVAWTPEGEGILFTKQIIDREGSTTEFWQVPARGGEPLQLGFHIDGQVLDLRVHPDGRRIAFGGGQGDQEIWLLGNFLP